ncbi:zinc finger MYM-type protein 1-like [Ambystoma mexicanum]|uniref:zinc finger MYM-type protein 1-like n=1 Tax=Ambystoma mexicanum TaxID=8296 RepID=UPI0037E701D6
MKEWYFTHKWLEYSQSNDSAYCYACRHFSLPSSGDSVFTSEAGFKNWKKATYKDGGFVGHGKSESHTMAMLAWAEYEKSIASKCSLSASLNAEYNKIVRENREYIKTVGETLLLTATQNIAQRAHKETEGQNKGNVLAIMELLAKHDHTVKRKMTSQKNATYLGHSTQNEIIDCLAEIVRTSVINEVAQSGAFSIMVDETKDIAKKEQMSLVIRYYYNSSICESFLTFEAAERLDAAALSQKIIQILQKYGLDYRNHLVGQAYDGASVMSGKNTGVQAHIKSEAPLAFYVHCNAHCLNLVLVDSVKCIPEAYCFFSLLQKLYVFVSGSYVHQRWLEVQRDMFQGAPREFQRLIETRWACRYNACKTVRDRLPALIRLLKEISEERNGDRAVEARGILAQIDLQFVGLLLTFTNVFGEIKHLSDILQSPQLNLGAAVNLVDSLVDTLNSYREGSVFNEIWNNTMTLAEQCNIAVAPPGRQVTPSSRLEGYYISMPIFQRHANTHKETFRAGTFIPIVDVLLSELKRRFSKESCAVMQGIQALNPSSPTFCEKNVVLPFASQYNCSTEDLDYEIPHVKRILDRRQTSGFEKPTSLLELTVFLEPYKEVFHEMFKLCKIALELPVSTAACERSFSVLKLIKTALRNTMSDERLSNLGLLSVESKRARAINLDEFVDVFAKRHSNRRIKLY